MHFFFFLARYYHLEYLIAITSYNPLWKPFTSLYKCRRYCALSQNPISGSKVTAIFQLSVGFHRNGSANNGATPSRNRSDFSLSKTVQVKSFDSPGDLPWVWACSQIQWVFLAALSSSRSLVVGPSVRPSVRPSVGPSVYLCEKVTFRVSSEWVSEWVSVTKML